MSEILESLTTPLFLVSMPQVGDSFFHRSVVLLLEHSDDGSYGLIVNRQVDLKVSAVFEELRLSWHGPADSGVHFGGPVQPNVGAVLFGRSAFDSAAYEVGSGLHLSLDLTMLRELGRNPPVQFRFLVGYAGWGAGQLEAELARNDWILVPFRLELLFSEPSTLWVRALESIGIRPESLPLHTSGESEKGN